MLKSVFLGIGALFYMVALYLVLFNDPFRDSALFQLVEDNAYNFLFGFLASVAFAVMGTGFFLLFAVWSKKEG